jgi:signal transduction histidine kinase/CheY-like chemotaxis protein
MTTPYRDLLRRIAEVTRAIVTNVDLDATLRLITDTARTLRPDSACLLRLVDETTHGYRLAAASGIEPGDVPAILAGEEVLTGVPIEGGGVLLGVLNVCLPPAAVLGEMEREAFDLLARHAAAAIVHARVVAESDRRRHVMGALGEVGRVLCEAVEGDAVAQMIADSVLELLGARSATVFRLDVDSGLISAVVAAGDIAVHLDRKVAWPPDVGTVGLALREGCPVVIDDVLADPRIVLPPPLREVFEAASYRAALAVPLRARGRIVGVLTAADRPGRRFGPADVEVARTFADQAALILEDARLFEEAEHRRRQAELLVGIAREIAAAHDLDAILSRLVEGSRTLCDGDVAAIALRDETTGRMTFCYWPSARPPRWNRVAIEPGKGAGGWVMAHGRAFRTDAYRDDDRITHDYDDVVGGANVAMIVAPIRGGERVDGLLYVCRPNARPFSDAEEAMLCQLAEHAALALHNARLLTADFLSIVSHELRTPAASIRNAAWFLERRPEDPVAVRRAAGVIARLVTQQARLLDDLLDLARIRHGKVELRKTAVDLGAVIGEAAEAVRALVDERRHTLALDLPGQPLIVEADRTRLTQVMTNLLHNAARYTPPGGRIGVRAWREGNHAVVTVTDTGVGLAADHLDAIFDLFTQSSARRSSEGLGIGLALVRMFTELHGGTVTVASEGVGRGTTFTVRVPVGMPGRRPLGVPRGGAPPARRLLVVEADADAREALRAVLELDGHVVDTAASGHEGIELAIARRPDVVLVALALPDTDGEDTARRLREALGDAVRLVALVDDGRADQLDRGRRSGFDGQLLKPVDPDAAGALLDALGTPR